jgi:uncharacterized protein (DUF433 family)
MHLPEFLTQWPDGEIVLTGHRIGLYHVVWYHNVGYSPEQLHEEFPTLSPEVIARVLEFYRQNRDEVDAYMARCTEEMERNRRAGKTIDLDELRRRMIAAGRMGPDGEWR